MLAPVDLRRRSVLGVVAVAVTALTLSGCAAGQEAQTVQQTSVVDGTAFQAGDVDLRDVGLRAPAGNSYAEGATAYLEGLMVNNNAQADQLLSVTSPIASKVEIYQDQVSALLALGSSSSSATATSSETASPSDSTSSSGSASPSDTASPTDTTSPTGTASTGASSSPAATTSEAVPPSALSKVPLPSQQSIQFGYETDQLSIVFLGLTQALFPSQAFPVTFTFANGGSVTHEITVKLPVGRTLDAPTVNTEEQEGEGG